MPLLVSFIEDDLKLHFHSYFIAAPLCRRLTETNFVFSITVLSKNFPGLTLS